MVTGIPKNDMHSVDAFWKKIDKVTFPRDHAEKIGDNSVKRAIFFPVEVFVNGCDVTEKKYRSENVAWIWKHMYDSSLGCLRCAAAL